MNEAKKTTHLFSSLNNNGLDQSYDSVVLKIQSLQLD